MAALLLSVGIDVNTIDKAETTALERAIDATNLPMARYLLSRGADPHIGRTLFAAIMIDPEAAALDFVKLLVNHGVDVRRRFPWFDDEKHTVASLDFAVAKEKAGIAAFLRAKGAIDEKAI